MKDKWMKALLIFLIISIGTQYIFIDMNYCSTVAEKLGLFFRTFIAFGCGIGIAKVIAR